MSAQAAPLVDSAPPKKLLFPPGIPFIVGNEGAERFSFYGMKQILYVYLVGLFLGFAKETDVASTLVTDAKVHATQVNHLFVAAVYAFPMIGAVLADRLLGKYRVILWVSMIYVAGHAALAVSGLMASQPGMLHTGTLGFYLGLGLIAVGSGGIKPCVAANVGDQFTKENGSLVNQVFQIFYFIINFGSFISTMLTPWLLAKFGPDVAFGVPGILMALATFVFWLGRNRFVKVPPKEPNSVGLLDVVCAGLFFVPLFMVGWGGGVIKDQLGEAYVWPVIGAASVVALVAGFALFALRQSKKQDDGFLAMMIYAILHQKERKAGDGFFGPVKDRFGAEAAEGAPAVLRIIGVFAFITFFWSLWDQNSSTWVEQAKHMNLTITVPTALYGYPLVTSIFGYDVPAPLFGYGLWAMVLGTGFGGVWLFRWIANRPLSRQVTIGALSGIGLLGVVSLLLQLIKGGTTDIPLEPAQIGSINPLLVMLTIPIMNSLVYNPMERRGTPLKPLMRITIGMFIASFAFVAVAVLQAMIDGGHHPNILWQSVPYLILTVSEVMVSITGLEFAYTQAPTKMKSTIQGFWLLAIAFGDLTVVFFAPLEKLGLYSFFWIFAGLMAGAALIFAVIAFFYKGKTYLQDAGAAAH